MFPNLRAEQSRNNMTNQNVADYLNMNRATYEKKKKDGKFTVFECMKLCKLFEREFNYLFATDGTNKTA